MMSQQELIEAAIAGGPGFEVVFHGLHTPEEQQYGRSLEGRDDVDVTAYDDETRMYQPIPFWRDRNRNIFMNTSCGGYVRIERRKK